MDMLQEPFMVLERRGLDIEDIQKMLVKHAYGLVAATDDYE